MLQSRKRLVAASAFAAVLAASSAAGAAELVFNGGFQSLGGPQPAPGGFATLSAGSPFLPGWQILSGNIDWIRGFWQSSDGDTFSVDMNGNQAGAIGQTISTVAGQIYRLSFDISGNPDFGSATRSVLVGAAGPLGTESYTFVTGPTPLNNRANMNYDRRTLTFTAAGTSTLITFASQNTGFYGAAIDNVSVTVPEPATWALLILGFGAAGAMLRRRGAVPA